MKNTRTQKISEEIKKNIMSMLAKGQIKNKEILDSRSIISITKIDVVRDLKYAYIYVSVLGNDGDDIVTALDKSSGYIRSLIGKSIKLRYTPELIFHLDKSIEEGINMIKLIDEVNNR